MLDKLFKGNKKFKGQAHKLGTSQTSQEKKSDVAAKRPVEPPGSLRIASNPGRPRSPAERPIPSSSSQQPQQSASTKGGLEETDKTAESPSRHSTSVQPLLDKATEPSTPPSELLDIQTAQLLASGELLGALALLESGPDSPREILRRIAANVLQSPNEPKFRRIRLTNPKIQAAVVDANGGLELLQACGFQVVMEDGVEGSPGDAYAVLPEDEDLTQMHAAVSLLGYSRSLPKHSQGSVETSPSKHDQPVAKRHTKPGVSNPNAEACDRETKVLLPSSSEGAQSVPEWVFQRTPAELKASLQAARRKREQSTMLMTRAMRDKLKITSSKPVSTKSVVRVRLPEGLLLQGSFNAGEPVAAIFDWVTDCLAVPDTTYELVLADRRVPLVCAMGTIRTADLLPSTLLNFHSSSVRAQGAQKLTLKDELMAKVQAS